MAVTATNRISWKGTLIGEHGYLKFDYSANNEVRVIPRGKGVKIRSTKELGGGVLTIQLTAFTEKSNRLALETFFNNLDSTFELPEEGDLVVEGALTLTDCYLESFSQGTDDFRWSVFNLTFIKSL